MNKIKNLLVVLTLVLTTTIITSADVIAQKLGHINSAELLAQMPKMKSAETQLETFTKQLDQQYQSKITDYSTKEQKLYEDIQKGILSQIEQQSRAAELEELRRTIGEFELKAQQDIASKRENLLNPILDEAQKAIEDVAAENGFTYIFDLSAGSILYYPPSDDIMQLVRAKLGI